MDKCTVTVAIVIIAVGTMHCANAFECKQSPKDRPFVPAASSDSASSYFCRDDSTARHCMKISPSAVDQGKRDALPAGYWGDAYKHAMVGYAWHRCATAADCAGVSNGCVHGRPAPNSEGAVTATVCCCDGWRCNQWNPSGANCYQSAGYVKSLSDATPVQCYYKGDYICYSQTVTYKSNKTAAWTGGDVGETEYGCANKGFCAARNAFNRTMENYVVPPDGAARLTVTCCTGDLCNGDGHAGGGGKQTAGGTGNQTAGAGRTVHRGGRVPIAALLAVIAAMSAAALTM